ncbi:MULTISPECIES: nucleotide exchange factor GrpE [unclassified Plantactinospora]|uniref:nucleotide exchange factor GrpE n=1 Tax=unclassified Plantactinospora TaxID=2631981 RepID=UPI000D168581|nr:MULTISPECIES: nucleotide exchange factor GrpE [unclassified Plantactinospora]AVT33401.1 nucleotide exchange factor GrpE [Plantactinospora sp. BC1]AVT40106.1 nucleotide exchange factor GrpE [Plantactinospora sp. BB1]
MTDKPRAADPEPTGSAPGGSATADPASGTAGEGVVIRNNRKINLTDEQPVPDGTTDGTRLAAKDPNPDPEPPGDAEPVVAAGEVDDTGSSGAAASVDDAKSAEDGPEVIDDATTERGGATTDDSGDPTSPVVDEDELAEVLAEGPPSGTDGPVVDAPVKPVTEADADGPGPLGAELGALRAELDERTRDLQRVTAEFANYRRRMDRERARDADRATRVVLAALLPVLDDLDRAREHGDLVGPFGTVADQLIGALAKFGLTPFGEKGDPFDPNQHEAVAHQTSAEVTEPTCVEVLRRGYQVNDALLRPAMVAVADPEPE